jgi:hypothetical protein
LAPHHERVHGALDVAGEVLFGLEWKKKERFVSLGEFLIS